MDVWKDLMLEMKTALITIEEIGLKQPTVCAVLLYRPVVHDEYTLEEINKLFGSEVEVILKGLKKISMFSDKRTAVESENYMKLLLSIAEDIRVVFIMIAQQLQLMRDAGRETARSDWICRWNRPISTRRWHTDLDSTPSSRSWKIFH